jgi:hypothetical protein
MLLKQAEIFSAWFKVLAAVLLSVQVYWNITPYGQVYIYRRFGRVVVPPFSGSISPTA